jgi:hypothetical protein
MKSPIIGTLGDLAVSARSCNQGPRTQEASKVATLLLGDERAVRKVLDDLDFDMPKDPAVRTSRWTIRPSNFWP